MRREYIQAIDTDTGEILGLVEPGSIWNKIRYCKGGRGYLRVRTGAVNGEPVAFFRKCREQPNGAVLGIPTGMRIMPLGAL